MVYVTQRGALHKHALVRWMLTHMRKLIHCPSSSMLHMHKNRAVQTHLTQRWLACCTDLFSYTGEWGMLPHSCRALLNMKRRKERFSQHVQHTKQKWHWLDPVNPYWVSVLFSCPLVDWVWDWAADSIALTIFRIRPSPCELVLGGGEQYAGNAGSIPHPVN